MPHGALAPPDPDTVYIITNEGGVMLSGTTTPAAGLGYNGDFYLNSTTCKIYGPKTSGGWGARTTIQAKWDSMTQAAVRRSARQRPNTLYVIVP